MLERGIRKLQRPEKGVGKQKGETKTNLVENIKIHFS
jgi:hypothetical protein